MNTVSTLLYILTDWFHWRGPQESCVFMFRLPRSAKLLFQTQGQTNFFPGIFRHCTQGHWILWLTLDRIWWARVSGKMSHAEADVLVWSKMSDIQGMQSHSLSRYCSTLADSSTSLKGAKARVCTFQHVWGASQFSTDPPAPIAPIDLAGWVLVDSCVHKLPEPPRGPLKSLSNQLMATVAVCLVRFWDPSDCWISKHHFITKTSEVVPILPLGHLPRFWSLWAQSLCHDLLLAGAMAPDEEIRPSSLSQSIPFIPFIPFGSWVLLGCSTPLHPTLSLSPANRLPWTEDPRGPRVAQLTLDAVYWISTVPRSSRCRWCFHSRIPKAVVW